MRAELRRVGAGFKTVMINEESKMGKEQFEPDEKELMIESEREKIEGLDKQIMNLEEQKSKHQKIIEKLTQGE